ncbi:MAG: hydroxymethylglutaryl-CoA synthase [Candidatus Micrarchaeales archaeon]
MASIVGYGFYIPRLRIKVEEIARVWGEDAEQIKSSLGVEEKSVPDIDEDTATMAVEAARNAINFAGIEAEKIGAIFVGSESHPYAVKPTASIVAEAVGAVPNSTAVDMEFACKAGTTAMQACMAMVDSGMIEYGLAIGSDVAQSRPGDALDYTSGAGACAFIIGKEGIADIKATASYTTDTPDFWRKQGASFPSHGGRFTGEPAYFKHIIGAAKLLFQKTGFTSKDFDFAVFHQPNAKFPQKVGSILGFKSEQIEESLLVKKIGNTYSASSMLGLASILEIAQPKQRILLTSFGSGAGSDSFVIEVNERIKDKKRGMLKEMLNNKEYVDYAIYLKNKRVLKSE